MDFDAKSTETSLRTCISMQNQQDRTSENGFRCKFNRISLQKMDFDANSTESAFRKWTSLQNQQNRTSVNGFPRKINRIKPETLEGNEEKIVGNLLGEGGNPQTLTNRQTMAVFRGAVLWRGRRPYVFRMDCETASRPPTSRADAG